MTKFVGMPLVQARRVRALRPGPAPLPSCPAWSSTCSASGLGCVASVSAGPIPFRPAMVLLNLRNQGLERLRGRRARGEFDDGLVMGGGQLDLGRVGYHRLVDEVGVRSPQRCLKLTGALVLHHPVENKADNAELRVRQVAPDLVDGLL